MTNGWQSSREFSRDRHKDIDKVERPIVTYYAKYIGVRKQ